MKITKQIKESLDKTYKSVNWQPSAAYLNHNSYGGSLFGYQSPTNNCQLSIVESFATILDRHSNDETIFYITCLIQATLGRKIILLDVNDRYNERITKIFGKDNIIMYSPYKSTNGSNMCIMLLKTECLKIEVIEDIKQVIKDELPF